MNMATKKKPIAIGQVWYDVRGDGFAVVRALDTNKTAVMSGPAEFWTDAHTCKSEREVQVAAIMEPDWEGPYDDAGACPRAHLHKWGFWNKMRGD